MSDEIKRIQNAITALKQGKMIVLTDDATRENEGDLVMPAETITPLAMNFMIKNGSGIVCLSLSAARAQQLGLPLLTCSDKTSTRAPFTISIDAKYDIESGVSAADRTHTILVAIADDANTDTLVRPGHVFPLQAQADGVLARGGHTEGSIDIVKLAGFKDTAVICEVMNADGSMARGASLKKFIDQHQLICISIQDIINYRLYFENQIADIASTHLPLAQHGKFELVAIREKVNRLEHLILFKKPINNNLPLLVRIHSACTTGDLFNSLRCDCNNELTYSLDRIAKEGGMLIYLSQEGRGIGLFNKIKAYELQDIGYDTVEANERLGLPVDGREYAIAVNILQHYGINDIRLLTNNNQKVQSVSKFDLIQVQQELMPVFFNEHNYQYLLTKKNKLNHTIQLNAQEMLI